jgi:hypothetical protein
VSPDVLKINCVMVGMSRQHGGPSITPWSAAEVENYTRIHEGRRNGVQFCVLVRGHRGRVLQCEFPVIHLNSRYSPSSPQVSE